MTQVSEVMSREVHTLGPDATLMTAAQTMGELDIGAIPVCDGESLVGMVTDSDIVLRGVARGCRADDTRLREVMSEDTRWCFEDDSVEEVVGQMREAQIRRMPVVDHEQHLVGMLSLGDVAVRVDEEDAGEALEEISQPSH